MRRGVANAFTLPSVLEMEQTINDVTLLLIETVQTQNEVDIARQLLWYSLDTAFRISFSEDIGFLQSDSDVGGTSKSIHGKLRIYIDIVRAWPLSDISQTGSTTGAGGLLCHGLSDSSIAIQYLFASQPNRLEWLPWRPISLKNASQERGH
jgi:hypothetical protein